MKSLIKDKRGVNFALSDWVVSLLLFGGIISLGFIMFADMAQEYDNTGIIDPQLQSRYNVLTNMTDTASSIYSSVTAPGGLTLIGSFNILFQSVFVVLQLVVQTLGLPGFLLGNLMIDMGVPSSIAAIVVPMWLAILTVTIIFILLSTNTRRDI